MYAANIFAVLIGAALVAQVLGSPLSTQVEPAQAVTSSGTSPSRAGEILGPSRFLSSAQVMSALNKRLLARGMAPIQKQPGDYVPYAEDVLKRHADGNWLLFWNPGLSLRELRTVFGTDSRSQPCFYDNFWWLGAGEAEWATRKSKPGYTLLRVSATFQGISWAQQEQEIKRLGLEYSRAPSSVVASAAVLTYLLSGERLFLLDYHWGPEADSHGRRVGIGDFFRTGLGVYSWPTRTERKYLGVALIRGRDWTAVAAVGPVSSELAVRGATADEE